MTVVETLTDAFNRRDIDSALACFTGDATYNDMFYGAHTGHADLRKMFDRMFLEGLEYQWLVSRVATTPEVELAEWTFAYVVSDAVPRSAGRHLCFSGSSVLELYGSRCRVYREYFDRGAALIQLGLPAEAMYKVLSRPT